MPKGVGYGKKTNKRVFSKGEKKDLQTHYEGRGAMGKKYKTTMKGKAAYKRAAKGKTSTAKKKG